MRNYRDFLSRKRAEYGDKFDPSGLAPQFVRFYETGDRIKVSFVGSNGEVYETLTGTVGVTTGWKPVFLLMRTSRSYGSPYTLSVRDRIIAKKQGRVYVSRGYVFAS